ncbi:MAG: DNA polymerase III subunit delta [Peptococcaceae bacterium]|nr:DNA polymerase III subunit delta [Peptococcaceae bacterium]
MNYFIELLNSLKRGVISPVYLFYGEEGYLREQAVSRFKQYFAGHGDAVLNYDLVDGETATPAEIVARAETLPFSGAKRLVVVKNPTFFKPSARGAGGEYVEGENGAGAPAKEAPLLDYLKNPLASTCLIFTTGDPVDKRKRLFRAVQKSGRAVEFTWLSRGELARWLLQRAQKEGRRFAPGAADALLDAAGPSLQRLVLELEKLINYTAGREAITPDDVRELCPPRPEESIFTIVDAAGNRRCGKALAGIKELLAAKEPPLKILAMIARQFRLLLQVHDLLERGCPARAIPEKLGVHPYLARKVVAQSKNYDRRVLIDAVKQLSELDVAVKTGRQEFYPAVETFLLRLCAGGCGEAGTPPA